MSQSIDKVLAERASAKQQENERKKRAILYTLGVYVLLGIGFVFISFGTVDPPLEKTQDSGLEIMLGDGDTGGGGYHEDVIAGPAGNDPGSPPDGSESASAPAPDESNATPLLTDNGPDAHSTTIPDPRTTSTKKTTIPNLDTKPPKPSTKFGDYSEDGSDKSSDSKTSTKGTTGGGGGGGDSRSSGPPGPVKPGRFGSKWGVPDGVGYEIGDRTVKKSDNCGITAGRRGTIVVNIRVNAKGKVISTSSAPGSGNTITDEVLYKKICDCIKSTWTLSEGTTEIGGTVRFDFQY